ncbi:MAG: EAL domain-containing protein [Spirochaetaceae bacterium]|jgi:diguanylate cyclase (GGDEF)-like protein|nr:EAL domain-containing protein [Spirochaetaceae bacterium]
MAEKEREQGSISRTLQESLNDLAEEINRIDTNTVSASLDTEHRSDELNTIIEAVNNMLRRIMWDRNVIKSSNEILNYKDNFDTTSGLKNRTSSIKKIEEIISRAKKEGSSFTLFFVDINRFKRINDTMGHNAGDTLIWQIAERFKQYFKDCELIGRTGGDDFVLVPNSNDPEQTTEAVVEKILFMFQLSFFIKDREMSFSASIGSASYPEDGDSANSLIKNAEMAMYKAKALCEGSYLPYHRDFQIALQKKIDMENQMRCVITNDCTEFQAFFQPKISTADGQIRSCEALIRWISPEGIVGPVEFIPLAEESGLVIPMTWWMIMECCKRGREFRDAGFEQKISINASAQVLLHEDFLSVIHNAIEETEMDPKQLDIEITESILLSDTDMEKVNRIFQELHELGIEVSVDDFGTGYSSLSYLHKLAVDRLKIDRSFVIRIDDGQPEDRAIINAIMAMAKSLHMLVTAEGIETQAQYDFLREIGCDEVQGYFGSKPLPADEYLAFLKTWKGKEK